jgi:hypothetical protein
MLLSHGDLVNPEALGIFARLSRKPDEKLLALATQIFESPKRSRGKSPGAAKAMIYLATTPRDIASFTSSDEAGMREVMLAVLSTQADDVLPPAKEKKAAFRPIYLQLTIANLTGRLERRQLALQVIYRSSNLKSRTPDEQILNKKILAALKESYQKYSEPEFKQGADYLISQF